MPSGEQKLGTVVQVGTAVVGTLYGTGFLINSIFSENYGIFRAELLRLEYTIIGITFFLITLGIVFIPLCIGLLTWNVRSASGLPNFYVGLVGNSINTLLFFSLPLFWSCFGTAYEWYLPLKTPLLFLKTIETSTLAVLLLSAFGMIIVPASERIVANRLQIRGFRFTCTIEPLRFLPIVISFVILYYAFSSMSWIPLMLRSGTYYFLEAIVFVVGMLAASLWIQYVRPIGGSTLLVYVLVSFGIAVLFYMTITAYIFGIYKFLPKNRGGALPVTEYFLKVADPALLPVGALQSTSGLGYGPFYLIQENDSYFFFGYDRADKWLTDFIPIHVLAKSKIDAIYAKRIEDGFPRTNTRMEPTK